MALFYKESLFDGIYETIGGEGDYEHGASGTVYMKKTDEDGEHKTLQVYNRRPLRDGEAWEVKEMGSFK